MAKEPVTIMRRRFTGRMLESGLLILAVALGVGAAASGLSLLFHTNQYSKEMLTSPAYREIVVTTKDNIDDMEQAVVEKLNAEDTTLTAADLTAAEIIPQVSYAYIQGRTKMEFLTDELLEDKGMAGRMPRNRPPREEEDPSISSGAKVKEIDDSSTGSGTKGAAESEEVKKFFEMVETFKKAKDNPEYIIPEIEDLPGYTVTPQFFEAWNIEASQGSLFTSTDMRSRSNLVILGSKAAELLTGKENNTELITGKKIISYETYFTIVGVLKPTGTDYDNYFFRPDTIYGDDEKFQMRSRFMNRQLRFAVTNPSDLDSAAILLKEWFEKAYGEGQIAVSNPREEAAKLVARNRGISVLILFLSMAGLFIASVNVSNILMSRSLRMKKHVGILKALGASKAAILKLFTGEAIFITITGSLVGMVLAFPLTRAMEGSLDLGKGSFWNILAGVGLSSILTLIFSIVPAWQNSGVNAAEAMRS